MMIPGLGRASSVEDLISHDSLYPATATCMHPDCTDLCHYPTNAQGRRQLFCSKRCTTDYSQRRQLFLNELGAIDAAVTDLPRWGNSAIQLRRQRSRVLWHLARYGGEPVTAP